MSAANPILEAALAYAARGWPVFPCHPETKAPLVPRGLKEASAEAGLVRAWWGRWPAAMIGLPLGGPTGLFALDFDPREETDPETGEVRAWTYADLKAETEALLGHALPATAAQKTPSGGFHIFYLQPEGEALGNRTGRLPAHVDVRGQGGYVIAAPSVRADGRAYAWVAQRDPDACPPAPAPEALVALIRAGKARSSLPANSERGPSPQPDTSEAVRKYALAALDAEARLLAGTPAGGRNNQINASAFALGQLVGAGAISQSTARACLLDVVRAWPDVAKSEKTIENGLAAGIAAPRDLSDIEAKAAERAERQQRRGGGAAVRDREPPRTPPGDEFPAADASSQWEDEGDDGWEGERGDGEDLDSWCAWRPLTDLGNAERFKARFGQDYLYTVAGGWLVWDGKRWEPHFHGKPPARLLLAVQACVRAIQGEAAAVSNPKRRKTLLAWAKTSEGRDKINAVVSLFQPMVTVRDDVFDHDPLLFNVQNGTLRFSKSDDGYWGAELLPHRREDMITKIGGVAYDRAASCPTYDTWLEMFQPDAEVRGFIHRWNGLSLTGVRVQKLVQSYGTGGNGKGTAAELYATIAGDYAGTINIESLLATNARSGQGASPDIAKLPGMRMLRVTEPEEGALLAEALVKRLTGGDPIDARHNYGPFFTFKPVFKMTLQGNYKLKIKGNDAGIWRRMRLLKWGVTIPEDQMRDDFSDGLQAELPGILNRLVAGALDYLQHGLSEPDAVKEATAEYRDESDPVGQFVALCVRASPGTRVGSRALHEVYKAWAVWSGNVDRTGRPLSELKFGERMETARFTRIKSGSVWWLDIELVKQAADFVDHDGNPMPVADGPAAPSVWEDLGPDGRTGWED
jgi:putative DNA primase/helicase